MLEKGTKRNQTGVRGVVQSLIALCCCVVLACGLVLVVPEPADAVTCVGCSLTDGQEISSTPASGTIYFRFSNNVAATENDTFAHNQGCFYITSSDGGEIPSFHVWSTYTQSGAPTSGGDELGARRILYVDIDGALTPGCTYTIGCKGLWSLGSHDNSLASQDYSVTVTVEGEKADDTTSTDDTTDTDNPGDSDTSSTDPNGGGTSGTSTGPNGGTSGTDGDTSGTDDGDTTGDATDTTGPDATSASSQSSDTSAADTSSDAGTTADRQSTAASTTGGSISDTSTVDDTSSLSAESAVAATDGGDAQTTAATLATAQHVYKVSGSGSGSQGGGGSGATLGQQVLAASQDVGVSAMLLLLLAVACLFAAGLVRRLVWYRRERMDRGGHAAL
jgi:hypothetical protein